MAKTTPMRLIELMVLKQDIKKVLLLLGSTGDFEFQDDLKSASSKEKNQEAQVFASLEKVRSSLDLPELKGLSENPSFPDEEDAQQAVKMIAQVEELHKKEVDLSASAKKIEEAYNEAKAFANLKASYSELENLSFLTMRVGKIDPELYDDLKFCLGSRAIIIPLGEDKSRILAACSKKARFALDSELKKYGFTELEIPKDFKGIPDEVLESLKTDFENSKKALDDVQAERKNYAQTHAKILNHLLEVYSVGSQVTEVENKLESTQLVYRIAGWLPAYKIHDLFKEIEKITQNRTAAREYLPSEVPSVVKGEEKVPVQLKHGKLVKSFERIIFSYGSPLYGTVDPTPFVAIFFTVLFGLMFGDVGQGFVFLLVGILMATKVIKVGGWNKFAPVFMCIGISSMIMGLLTGEVFANEEVLIPFSRWVTSLFGEPRDQILHLMPSASDPSSVNVMFMFFGFTCAVGFVINTVGIIINIVNQFSLGKKGKAIFGKTGISGAIFFWYVVFFGVKVILFHKAAHIWDYLIIALSLFCTAFGEPFSRMVDGKKPVLENGLFAAVIEGIVELLETIISYLSNSISFLRVGAFALSHAVLSYITASMSSMFNSPVAGVIIAIAFNALIIVLEGMIVAIQVIRLQYYELFSKFFNETGREFCPFGFSYKPLEN